MKYEMGSIFRQKNPLAIIAEGNRWVGVGLGKYNKERIAHDYIFQEIYKS